MIPINMKFYIGAMFIFVLIPITLGGIGLSLLENGTYPLTEKSKEFINIYSGLLESNNMTSAVKDQNAELKEDNILTGDNETKEDFKDNFMANLNFFRLKINQISNSIKLVYNAPSFFILSLGLDVADFKDLINLMTLVLFLSITILILRELK